MSSVDNFAYPKWMDESYFQGILSQYENAKNLQVLNLKIARGSEAGDNFASLILRCKVTYKSSPTEPAQTISLILKNIPESKNAENGMLDEVKMFETEIQMYGKVLPQFEMILAEHGDNVKFAPRLLYHSLEPHKVVVMEDLCRDGYEVVRGRYPSEEEIFMIYRKLAKMHAVSYVLARQPDGQEKLTQIQNGLFSRSAFLENEQFLKRIEHFEAMLHGYDEFKEYIPKAMKEDLFDEIKKLYSSQGHEGDVMVLNHGDLHLKNMMVKYGNGKQLDDILLVDFQFAVYAPATVDLLYSLFMLVTPEIRLKRRDELLLHYLEQFAATLKLLNFPGDYLKFEHLKRSFIKYRHFVAYMMSAFLPVAHGFLTQDPEQLRSRGIDPSKSESIELIYKMPEYSEDMKLLLPSLMNEGYLW